MEKIKRLKLYSEKDYTEMIDFPVELIGRDGVVRKYSYAESIRIYERRIESAHIRYSDREIINAEIYHCSRRLEQIKRSWKQRISSSEREFIEGRPIPKDRELYERGKRFLCAYIERLIPGVAGRPDLTMPNLVNLEERSDCQIFYVNSPVFHPGTLLYVYRTDALSTDVEMPAYLAYIEILRTVEHAPDIEKLVHHEVDSELAFILTSPRQEPLIRRRDPGELMMGNFEPVNQEGGLPEGLSWLEGIINRDNAPDDGPYRQGLEALRAGDFEMAFSSFREALDSNPFYKEAYWALAALTDHLGRWEESEPYMLMALKYFPDEPMAHYNLGLVQFRRNRLKEALPSFQEAVRLNIRQSRAFGLLACTHALHGRYGAAAESLEQGLRAFPRDRALLKLAIPLHRGLRWRRRVLAVACVLVAVVGTLSVAFREPLGLAAAVGIVAGVLAAHVKQQREYRRQLLEWSKPG